jgi:hypothetical protein
MTSDRVYVDFMKRDHSDRVLLTTLGTQQDLQRLGIALRPGLELRVYSDDLADDGSDNPLLAEGVAEYDDEAQRWVLRLNKGSLRHRSDPAGV